MANISEKAGSVLQCISQLARFDGVRLDSDESSFLVEKDSKEKLHRRTYRSAEGGWLFSLRKDLAKSSKERWCRRPRKANGRAAVLEAVQEVPR
jgi:hypothetical protein